MLDYAYFSLLSLRLMRYDIFIYHDITPHYAPFYWLPPFRRR